ncbi:MAG: RNA polymerase sigma factor RpoH [Thiobacillaceae bacterium]
MNTALTLNFPVAAQSLEGYIHVVNQYPLLSADEEQELARRWKERQDLEAARQLVLSHLRVVPGVARHYLGYGLPQADLIQEGNIGLMKAVRRFDPDRGVRLVSFALHWIKAEIHEYILRNWRLVKVATTKAQRKLFFNLRSMRSGLGSLSTAETESIAKALGVKPEEVREMETRMSGQDIGLNPTVDDGEETFSPIAYLASPEDEPVNVLAQEQTERLQHEGLVTALDSLDDRSRKIIESRWLNSQEPATLHELAAEYGVSAERIRQIEAKALQKMRALIPA